MGAKDAGEILTLVCPHCDKSFPSAVQMDRAAFAAIQLKNMRERCSACLRASRFIKDDYSFVTVEGPP